MNRNNWTVIFLPGDVRAKRQYTLSTRKVRALAYGLCVAGAWSPAPWCLSLEGPTFGFAPPSWTERTRN